MVIKGKLITCKRQVKEFKGQTQKEKLYITLAEAELSDKQKEALKEAFKDAGKNFTPAWIKKFDGYVNTATEYDLPCRDLEGNEHQSIEDWITDSKFPYMGAEVKLSIDVKEGAVYPRALIFLTEGKPFNAFAEFDNDEED